MEAGLLQKVKVDYILGYYAAGTTKRTSTIIDMAGYDGVLFLALLGTIIEAGTIDVAVEQNTANSTSGMARVATTSAHTVTAANAALTQSVIAVDVFRPQERYLQAFITPASQNAVILGIVAIRYHGRVQPDANADLLTSFILASPEEA